ncbi:hypothetical protein [Xylella fastidiosa]|uniref:hypothetical protein n=1 Tax=Xylella fastidiosa TaxID=2371 RepID=UPI003D048437
MIQTSYTEVEPLQLLIMRYSRTIFLSYFYAAQTFKLNSQGKPVFEINHLPLEVVDKVCGARLIVGLFSIIMEHKFHKSAFGQHRGNHVTVTTKTPSYNVPMLSNNRLRSSSTAAETASGK